MNFFLKCVYFCISGSQSSHVLGKDGTSWKKLQLGESTSGRYPAVNVLRRHSGPAAFATALISNDDPVSAFRVLFSENLIRLVCKYTTAEGNRMKPGWNVKPAEMDVFLGLWLARGVIGSRRLPLRDCWSEKWGCRLFTDSMSRNRFMEIKRFLRFDDKNTRSSRVCEDKFCLISELWKGFIENCQLAFYPGENLTIDEQLLPCKARCRFFAIYCKQTR